MSARNTMLFAALLVGCNPGVLSPTRTLVDDPMVAALPPGLTLIGGVDLAALDQGGLAPAFAERTGVFPSEAPWRAGLDGSSTDRMVLGCGDHGCLGLAEGELSGLDWCALAQRRGADLPHHSIGCSADEEPGLDVTLPTGEPMALRQLSPTKLVIGDRAAVRSAYPQAGSHPDSGFDTASLEGMIPQGSIWLAAHEPSRMALQAAHRLEQNGSPQATAMATQLRELVDCCSEQLEDVVAVALAVDTQDEPTAVFRVTCRDAWTARGVERAIQKRLDRALEDRSPTWLEALDDFDLVRAGDTVELRGHSTQGALEAWLDTAEASP